MSSSGKDIPFASVCSGRIPSSSPQPAYRLRPLSIPPAPPLHTHHMSTQHAGSSKVCRKIRKLEQQNPATRHSCEWQGMTEDELQLGPQTDLSHEPGLESYCLRWEGEGERRKPTRENTVHSCQAQSPEQQR